MADSPADGAPPPKRPPRQGLAFFLVVGVVQPALIAGGFVVGRRLDLTISGIDIGGALGAIVGAVVLAAVVTMNARRRAR